MMRYLVLVPALLSLLVISGCTQITSTQQATLDWCVTGETWFLDYQGETQGIGKVTGVTTYKEQTRCQVTRTLPMDGGDVTTNLYILDEEGNDLWATIHHPSTGTIEGHMVNMQCVEGDCEEFENSVLYSATPRRSN